ncbi:MAG: hypothetical protein Q4F17_03340 [Eubacteriales bacterium]|nr:hypothetical protein [Eubacteriales bacterium]
MQLKTSCCNKTVIRKDLTRFAPVWGAYILALVMGVFLLLDEDRDHSFANHLTTLPMFMAVVNCGYAMLVAQLLFGDLYTARSCYALHAMPLRRETWLGSHIVSGLVMSLVPTLIMAILATVLTMGSVVERAWMLPWYVFGAVNLQYLFFFGLACLSSFFAGNRLGMIACYGAANFLAGAVAAVVHSLYQPMLYGLVPGSEEKLLVFSPMLNITEQSHLLEIPDYGELLQDWWLAKESYPLRMSFTTGEGWGYLAVIALLGIVFLGASLVLYRRRKLEAAGDLLAVKPLEPLFQIGVALACGYGFQFVHDSLTDASYNPYYATQSLGNFVRNRGWFLFLAVGLVVGWFGARMLLERSARVFRKQAVPGLVVLAAVVALTFAGTAMDPLGLETWMPDPEDVASVGFAQDYYLDFPTLERPGDLETVMNLHAMALNERVTAEELADSTKDNYGYTTSFCVKYTMKNGSEVKRRYQVWADGPTAQAALSLWTRPEVVLSDYFGVFDISQLESLYINGPKQGITIRDQAELDSFLAAFYADCEAGTMAQGWLYHRNKGWFGSPYDETVVRSSIDVNLEGKRYSAYLSVYPDCANTLQWLQDRDVLKELNLEPREGDYDQQSTYIAEKYAEPTSTK